MTPGDAALRARSTFVLLSGGESRRMGRDKSFLPVGGREMLDRILEAGRAACGACVLVVRDPDAHADALARYGWREAAGDGASGSSGRPGTPARRFRRDGTELTMVRDRHPGRGPVAGLEAGLAAAATPLCFAAACDLPFLAPPVVTGLLEELETLRAGADEPGACAAVPVVQGRLQPLAAAYAAGAARAAARCVESGDLRMDDLLGRLAVRRVDADELRRETGSDGAPWFLNVNRPEELRRARRRAGGPGGRP